VPGSGRPPGRSSGERRRPPEDAPARPRRRPEPEEEYEEPDDRRRYEDEEEYEEEPPRRRRPPPRRRYEEEYEEDQGYEEDEGYEDEPPRRRPAARMRRAELRRVALYQKFMLVGLLIEVIYILVVVFSYVAGVTLPPALSLTLALVVSPVALATTVFAFLLAIQVYGTGLGVFFGILTLVPCIGLIMLVVINIKATSILQAHGYHVGLLGASLSELRD
jgi:hypothetical protein